MNTKNPVLHQQNGGMSIQAFADQVGLLKYQVISLAKRGLVFGARKNALTKKWWVYPPARLLEIPRVYNKKGKR